MRNNSDQLPSGSDMSVLDIISLRKDKPDFIETYEWLSDLVKGATSLVFTVENQAKIANFPWNSIKNVSEIFQGVVLIILRETAKVATGSTFAISCLLEKENKEKVFTWLDGRNEKEIFSWFKDVNNEVIRDLSFPDNIFQKLLELYLHIPEFPFHSGWSSFDDIPVNVFWEEDGCCIEFITFADKSKKSTKISRFSFSRDEMTILALIYNLNK